jgi:hypothetical protein
MARGAPAACNCGTSDASGMTAVLRHVGRPGKGRSRGKGRRRGHPWRRIGVGRSGTTGTRCDGSSASRPWRLCPCVRPGDVSTEQGQARRGASASGKEWEEGAGHPRRSRRSATTHPRRWGRSAHMAATLWPRVVLKDISPNTCGVTVWPAWETNLGCFQAKSDNGPNMKFVALMMLYNFHLGCKIISAVD